MAQVRLLGNVALERKLKNMEESRCTILHPNNVDWDRATPQDYATCCPWRLSMKEAGWAFQPGEECPSYAECALGIQYRTFCVESKCASVSVAVLDRVRVELASRLGDQKRTLAFARTLWEGMVGSKQPLVFLVEVYEREFAQGEAPPR